MKKQTTFSKLLTCFLCLFFVFMPAAYSAQDIPCYKVSLTSKDTAMDFNNFLRRCSLEERIALMQSLQGVDEKIKDECFGQLEGLPELSHFTTNKKKASQSLPLKPKTYNEVLPITVSDAISKGYLKAELFTPLAIKKKLLWRRYNKLTIKFHDPDNINYHKDIVEWIAKKNKVNNTNNLSTYEMEKQLAFKLFEKIWDQLTPEQREELLRKIEKETGISLHNKGALALQGGAVAIATLSTTVACMGFAFYTTMSTVICSTAAYFGTTAPFAVYAGASTTVAVLAGPIGWCLAGLALAGSAVLIGWREPDIVAAFVVTVNIIKTKWLQEEKKDEPLPKSHSPWIWLVFPPLLAVGGLYFYLKKKHK